MKAKIVLAFAALQMITFQILFSQRNTSSDNCDLTNSEPYLTGELFAPALPVDATTYFNSEWLSGDIYLSNGEVVRNKLIKYNGLLDELFWQEPKSKNIIKLDKEAILQFHFLNFKGDTSVYFRKIKVKRYVIADSSEVFGEVIYDGSLSLFVLHTFFIERRELINMNGIPYQKDIYAEEPIYYFRFTNNKTFVTKSLNRNSLYAFFPGNKDKIKKFLKANNFSKFINKSYLIRLTQLLESILPYDTHSFAFFRAGKRYDLRASIKNTFFSFAKAANFLNSASFMVMGFSHSTAFPCCMHAIVCQNENCGAWPYIPHLPDHCFTIHQWKVYEGCCIGPRTLLPDQHMTMQLLQFRHFLLL